MGMLFLDSSFMGKFMSKCMVSSCNEQTMGYPFCFAHIITKGNITDNLTIEFIRKGFSRIEDENNNFILIIGPSCLSYFVRTMTDTIEVITNREEILKGRIGYIVNVNSKHDNALILEDYYCEDQDKVIFCNAIDSPFPFEMEYISQILSHEQCKSFQLRYRE
jgi:hypothetical protein